MGKSKKEKQFDKIVRQIEDLRDHAEWELSQAKECNSLPEIEEGEIPYWRRQKFSERERAIYHLGRYSGMTFGAGHVELGVRKQRDQE